MAFIQQFSYGKYCQVKRLRLEQVHYELDLTILQYKDTNASIKKWIHCLT